MWLRLGFRARFAIPSSHNQSRAGWTERRQDPAALVLTASTGAAGEHLTG